MNIVRPIGTNLIFNKNHEDGLRPLPTRSTPVVGIKGVFEFVSGWEPTPDELNKLNQGGYIEASIIHTGMPPILLSVVEAADPVDVMEYDRLFADIDKACDRLRRFFCQVLDEWTVQEENGSTPDLFTRHHALTAIQHINKTRKAFKDLEGMKDEKDGEAN